MCLTRRSKRNQHAKRKRVHKYIKTISMALFIKFIIFLRIYIDKFIEYLFGFYYTSQRAFLTKPENLLVLESATSLAKKIREKEVTSEEVVRAFIEQIKEVDPIINAITDSRFDDAIKEAKAIDQHIASAKPVDFKEKPFLGVPFTTKESTICKGLKCTFGLVSRKDVVGEEDADAVATMKEAGGILIGVSNVPIINMWVESSNLVYGATNNPYDTTRNAGGSSGGEAAIIAACGSPIGIASDIGGSIRIPAYMCGVFGHKPSTELISIKGLTYRKGNEIPTMVTCGPITKYAEDLIPLLKVLMGKNASRLTLDENVNVKDLKIFYVYDIEDPKVIPIGEEVRMAIKRAVDYFTDTCKVAPEPLNIPNIKHGGKLWRYNLMTQEKTPSFFKQLKNLDGEINPCVEIFKFLTFQSEYNAPVILFTISTLLPVPDAKWAQNIINELRNEIIEKLGDNGVILYPTSASSARFHNFSLVRPWEMNYCAIWSALKFPTTQVPLGLDKDGLPVGVQVVAAPYQDHLCIAVARELEKAFGGYVPPFTLDKES